MSHVGSRALQHNLDRKPGSLQYTWKLDSQEPHKVLMTQHSSKCFRGSNWQRHRCRRKFCCFHLVRLACRSLPVCFKFFNFHRARSLSETLGWVQDVSVIWASPTVAHGLDGLGYELRIFLKCHIAAEVQPSYWWEQHSPHVPWTFAACP